MVTDDAWQPDGDGGGDGGASIFELVSGLLARRGSPPPQEGGPKRGPREPRSAPRGARNQSSETCIKTAVPTKHSVRYLL
eukprot:3434093-Pyramimonas_sp.AAC.1